MKFINWLENENNLNKFYTIIGIISLLFSLIGTFFAYLNFIKINIYTVNNINVINKLDFKDIKDGLKNNLISVSNSLNNYSIGGYDSDDNDTEIDYRFIGIGKNDCKDLEGNNICSVYQFTISNNNLKNNNFSMKIYTFFDIKENSFSNLHYALFKGSVDDIENLTKKVVSNDSEIINISKEIRFDDAKKNNKNISIGDTILVGYDVDGVVNNKFTTEFDNFTKNKDDAIRKNIIGNDGDLIVKDSLIPNSEFMIDFPLLTQVLDNGESVTYTVVMWLDKNNIENNIDYSGSFIGRFKFIGDEICENSKSYNVISDEIIIR